MEFYPGNKKVGVFFAETLSMFFWALAFLSGGLSIQCFYPDIKRWIESLSVHTSEKEIQHVIRVLGRIEDLLVSGCVPQTAEWESLSSLPHPWGSLSDSCFKALRSCGAAILPTLARIRNVATEHGVALMYARAQSAQALAQAGICSSLVPLIGVILYEWVPGIAEQGWIWGIACGLAIWIAGCGAIWLIRLSDAARWGGLQGARRSWVLSSQCTGEKFLALVRSGMPPDLAWVRACELLRHDAQELSVVWGHSIWETSQVNLLGTLEKSIASAGSSMKRAVQVSLMEGRPCVDKVEAALLALRKEVHAQIQRELSLLATRALKPLFCCVAPALFGLLACGLWLAARESLMGW